MTQVPVKSYVRHNRPVARRPFMAGRRLTKLKTQRKALETQMVRGERELKDIKADIEDARAALAKHKHDYRLDPLTETEAKIYDVEKEIEALTEKKDELVGKVARLEFSNDMVMQAIRKLERKL